MLYNSIKRNSRECIDKKEDIIPTNIPRGCIGKAGKSLLIENI